jgi:hypothetical protein
MKRPSGSRFLLAILIVILGLGSGGAILHQHLKARTASRESSFIAIHYLVAAMMDEGQSPNGLDAVFTDYGEAGGGLLKDFPQGLVFHREGRKFRLEENDASRVSLFRSDRLVATDELWPRWERSGELAKKFESQKVPDRYR